MTEDTILKMLGVIGIILLIALAIKGIYRRYKMNGTLDEKEGRQLKNRKTVIYRRDN
ncbi:MAG: hypothetical protein AAB586_01305 [Patescibacteria group bacterium]